MENWERERVELLLGTGDEKRFFNLLHEIVGRLGFDYYAFGMRLPLPLSNPTLILRDNCPAGWQWASMGTALAFAKTENAQVDPSADPLVWSVDLPMYQPPFWRDAAMHGLKAGWGQACHGPMGISSALNLATTNTRITPRDLDFLSPRLTWLTHVAHRGLAQLLIPKYLPESQAHLSGKEVQILRLTADGKTCGAIGRIMHISERTVHFHIEKILQKLVAANKTAAALKAAMLGLL
ncbi:autoinducer binding domain-containing protein [Bordetella genomosp. 11]|nr:autoinducer binding domain-containing protein [Bordetella genomosp. 11]